MSWWVELEGLENRQINVADREGALRGRDLAETKLFYCSAVTLKSARERLLFLSSGSEGNGWGWGGGTG